jgi:hypothetical protein
MLAVVVDIVGRGCEGYRRARPVFRPLPRPRMDDRRWTGARPQQNDHEWLRFGREIVCQSIL